MNLVKIKVTKAGHVAGEPRKEGEVLTVTERQAACGLRRGRIEVLGEAKVSGGAGEDEAALAEVRSQLDALGISWRKDAKLSTLEAKLAEAQSDPTA